MSTKTSTPPAVKQVDARASRKQNRLLIWVFLAPTLIGLGLFSFIPIIGGRSVSTRAAACFCKMSSLRCPGFSIRAAPIA